MLAIRIVILMTFPSSKMNAKSEIVGNGPSTKFQTNSVSSSVGQMTSVKSCGA